MPRLSIILSAAASVESLEGTLLSVLENRPSDSEIIIALGGPYADPYDLKDEVRFLPPARRAGTVATINAALAAAKSPFVHLLAAGCQVSEGWADAALARFGDRRLAAVSPLVWQSGSADRLFAAGVGYKLRGQRLRVGDGLRSPEPELLSTVIGPCHFAGFYRKTALELVGGFCTKLAPRQADADLAIVLRTAGFTATVEPRSNVWAGAEVDAAAAALAEALGQERLFWRNSRGQGTTRALVSHLALASGDVLAGLPGPKLLARFVGRLRGALELGAHARHQRLLAELAARSVRPKLSGDNVRIDASHENVGRSETQRTRVSAR